MDPRRLNGLLALVAALGLCSCSGDGGSSSGLNRAPVNPPREVYLSFDGTNDSVTVPDADSLDLAGAAFTVAAWINPASWGEDGRSAILDHGGAGAGGASATRAAP